MSIVILQHLCSMLGTIQFGLHKSSEIKLKLFLLDTLFNGVGDITSIRSDFFCVTDVRQLNISKINKYFRYITRPNFVSFWLLL